MSIHITTKKGDRGETSALSGDRVAKDHILIECSGCVDELRAQLALLRLQIIQSGRADNDSIVQGVYWLMNATFLIGAQCSDPELKKPRYSGKHIEQAHLERLEAFQVDIERVIDLPACFIAGASTMAAAHADLACTAARRLERTVVRLAGQYPCLHGKTLLPFLNRVSDYLFLVARALDEGHFLPVDYSVLDTAPERGQ